MKRELHGLFRKDTGAFFIKIGAHNGVHGDPIRELVASHEGWREVFVEPVPHLFERLRANGCD